MREAELVETDAGLVAKSEGWFVMNLRDAAWESLDGGGNGTWLAFEAEGVPNQIGVGAHLLPPGESTGLYHREGNQEGFLVLEGECVVVVEGEERTLRRWDYFHCPPGTAHIMIGGTVQPCVLFMFGNRLEDSKAEYLVDPVAARHGVSVAEPTSSSKEAYGPRSFSPARSPWPPA
jgi:uncharacterized cupin superfamily protein